MDRVPINQGYNCGQCGKWIPMEAFDGINEGGQAICYVCRENGIADFLKYIGRLVNATCLEDRIRFDLSCVLSKKEAT